MKLIIAEKPSVGRTIAEALGCKNQKEGYIGGTNCLISWGFGHLVELAPAEYYNPALKEWNLRTLPILPRRYEYLIKEDGKKQFSIIKNLINSPEVSLVIAATDADREGELIFRLIYEKSGSTKPVKRLWLSSMEKNEIISGMNKLSDIDLFNNLYIAAKCRQQADWLFGINFTRAMTKAYGALLPIGRVMTPTLGLIVERDLEIKHFKKEKFYSVVIDIGFKLQSNRFKTKEEAETVAIDTKGSMVKIIDKSSKPFKQNPPHLFDLTSLQREANKVFGYASDQILNALQELYEKAIITYPRTESKFISSEAKKNFDFILGFSFSFLRLQKTGNEDTSKVVSDEKVISHPAIIITSRFAKSPEVYYSLDEIHKNILSLILFRMVEAVQIPYEYEETTISAACEKKHNLFQYKGKKSIRNGWKEFESVFYKRNNKDGFTKKTANSKIPNIFINTELPQVCDPVIEEGETSSPKKFTDATLLSAMERASAEEFKSIENPEHEGLGTPATRAAIISKLIEKKLIQREGRNIISTEKGQALIAAVPVELKDSYTTAKWEKELKAIEKGKNPAFFIDYIINTVKQITYEYKNLKASREVKDKFDSRPIVGVCPICGNNIVETNKTFSCEDNNCGFTLWKDDCFFCTFGKKITNHTATTLLKNKKCFIRGLKSNKTGKTFDAVIIMDISDGKAKFRLSFDDELFRIIPVKTKNNEL